MFIHLTKSVIDFLKKSKTEIIMYPQESTLYLIGPKSGARIVKLPNTEFPLKSALTLPIELVEQLFAGFYSIQQMDGFVLLSIHNSPNNPVPIVSHRIYSAISYGNYIDYIYAINNQLHTSYSLPKDVLRMYSLVTSLTKSIYHTIEFANSMAYFSSPNLSLYCNIDCPDEFSINKNNMWFLACYDNVKISITSNMVIMHSNASSSDNPSYYVLFSKIRTGQPPKLSKLDELDSLSVQSINLNTMNAILTSLREDKHNSVLLQFVTEGYCMISQGNIKTIIPLETKPNINFKVEAITIKKIAAKLSGVAALTIYNGFYILRQKKISIVGRCIV